VSLTVRGWYSVRWIECEVDSVMCIKSERVGQ